MSTSTRGERITAALSALAAIVILGAAVTAQQSHVAPARGLAGLESDLRYQLYLAHRTDRGRLAERLTELNQTLDAWQRSPRTAADDLLLREWLAESIDRTMPGESGELPPAPPFGKRAESAPSPTAPSAVESAPTPRAPTPEPAAPVPTPRPTLAAAPPTAAAAALAEPLASPKPAVEHSVAKPSAPAEHSVASKPSVRLPVAAPVAEEPPVAVNLAELNSRITGYHHGLGAVEAAIAAAGDGLEMKQLASLVDDLERLSRQHELVALYYNLLSEGERATVATPRGLGPTVELVERELAKLESGDGGDFLAAFEAPNDSQASLLADRLKALAGRSAPKANP